MPITLDSVLISICDIILHLIFTIFFLFYVLNDSCVLMGPFDP